MKNILLISLVGLFAFCHPKIDVQREKQILLEIDRDFSRHSRERGTSAAFLEFMAEDVRLLPQKGEPIEGREAYRRRVSTSNGNGEPVYEWEPRFADIASSGDLGYTFGSYVVKIIEGDQSREVRRGYYVTIWKKQADGSWKFVFDAGNETNVED